MKERIFTYPSADHQDRGFFISKRYIQAGTDFPVHWHDYYEFEIVLSGRARHIHNNTVSEIGTGCAYLMCYHDFHSMTALTDLMLYKVHLKKEFLSDELADYLEFHTCDCQFTDEETRDIERKLLKLESEVTSNSPFCDLLIRNGIENILISLLRKQTNVSPSTTLPPPIHQTVIYLNKHYREAITLEEMAQKVSLSPNYFGQLFKAEVGASFHKYLNTLRLKFACNLLASSSLSVKEIAFSSGYNSLEYFMYIFKNQLSMTPTQYRTCHNTVSHRRIQKNSRQ